MRRIARGSVPKVVYRLRSYTLGSSPMARRVIMRRRISNPLETLVLAGLLLSVLSVGATGCGPRASTSVDEAVLRNAGADTANWLTHGRTYSEQRHSPLTQEAFEQIVRGGVRRELGMPSFGDDITSEQLRSIQSFILWRARESAEAGGGD